MKRLSAANEKCINLYAGWDELIKTVHKPFTGNIVPMPMISESKGKYVMN